MKTLSEIAEDTMIGRGFIPGFSEEIQNEVARLQPQAVLGRDLRHFFWVSIDNIDSKDLDQLTYAEENRIYVAIADVDSLVKKDSAIDQRAANNTTSVYTPTKIFPMLPLKLSNDLTSLNANAERAAIVAELTVADDGQFELVDVYPAQVINKAKLNYPCVGAFLENRSCEMPNMPGIEEQIRLQDQFAQKIRGYRAQKGALEFGTVELQPVLENGVPVSLEMREVNRAHQLIENFMIAANVAVTQYLERQNKPTIRRIVKTPKRWDRIVALAKDLGATLPPTPDPIALRAFLLEQKEKDPTHFPHLSLAIIKLLGRGEYVLSLPNKSAPGHFDLAEKAYGHATAPNRRYPDLIVQRLIKGCPYSEKELRGLAATCTQKEQDAEKVERKLIKCTAAFVLQKEIGKTFKAMVTGAKPHETWVRLIHLPIEGKLVEGYQNLDVGDFVTVKLIHVNVLKGHIDFANILL